MAAEIHGCGIEEAINIETVMYVNMRVDKDAIPGRVRSCLCVRHSQGQSGNEASNWQTFPVFSNAKSYNIPARPRCRLA
jgi:hypothetical protein